MFVLVVGSMQRALCAGRLRLSVCQRFPAIATSFGNQRVLRSLHESSVALKRGEERQALELSVGEVLHGFRVSQVS